MGTGKSKPKRPERSHALEVAPQTWLDIWALCRRDHGLTWAEFEDLTLAQLEALEERRAIAIRHSRHDAAFIVATLFNLNRTADIEPLSPYDFLPGFERDPEERAAEQRRKEIIKGIRSTFAGMIGASKAEVLEMRDKMVTRLQADGYEDAAEIMTQAFPNL